MTAANTKTQAESFTGNLFLIGFMGSGKSTIAAELSRILHRPVLEMDEEIEKREGMSIPAIFSEHGEAYFRQLETDLLKETSALGGFLVSCGGGAAMREENVREMKKSGIIVLLTALPETILERVADDENRPLLKGRKNTADIEALIEKHIWVTPAMLAVFLLAGWILTGQLTRWYTKERRTDKHTGRKKRSSQRNRTP